jgi:hypothetical protein
MDFQMVSLPVRNSQLRFNASLHVGRPNISDLSEADIQANCSIGQSGLTPVI